MTLFERINDFRIFSGEKKNNFKKPLALGVIFGVIVVMFVLFGYGVIVYGLWPVFLGFVIFFGLPTIFQKSVLQFFFNSLIVFLIPVALYFLSTKIQIFRKSLVRNELNILIEQVNAFYKKNGDYPTSLSDMNFSTMLRIHTEIFNYDGLNYDEINENDAIV